MKPLKHFLKEYLTDEQRNRFKPIQMSTTAKSATDHFFGPNNNEVREDVIGLKPEKSEVHRAIERHLGKEITQDEYVNNTTKDQYGRDVRLARLIRDDNLRNQFANDNTRAGSKKSSGHYMTIVRGTEVAGQTNSAPDPLHPNGHSWCNHSCKNVDTGINRHYLEDEIRNGTVVVRAHDHTGQEIYRATLQPHSNGETQAAYAVDSEYGLKHPAFTNHAHDVAHRLSGSPNIHNTLYKKHSAVYNDNGEDYILHPNLSSEQLQFVANNSEKAFRHTIKYMIANHPNVTSATLDQLAGDNDETVRLGVAKSRYATQHHLDRLLADQDDLVQEKAAENPNMREDRLTEILSNKEKHYEYAINAVGAARNPNLKPHHFEMIKDHPNEKIWRVATTNHSAPESFLIDSLNKKTNNRLIAINTAYNPSLRGKGLDIALAHGDPSVRAAAAENPNMSSEQLHKALSDDADDVRLSAMWHPKIQTDHIDRAIKDKRKMIRSLAASHEKISKEALSIALNDKESDVQESARQNPKYKVYFK